MWYSPDVKINRDPSGIEILEFARDSSYSEVNVPVESVLLEVENRTKLGEESGIT